MEWFDKMMLLEKEIYNTRCLILDCFFDDEFHPIHKKYSKYYGLIRILDARYINRIVPHYNNLIMKCSRFINHNKSIAPILLKIITYTESLQKYFVVITKRLEENIIKFHKRYYIINIVEILKKYVIKQL
jgi:hypothetical protein